MTMMRLKGERSNVFGTAIETGRAKSATCQGILKYLNEESRPFD